MEWIDLITFAAFLGLLIGVGIFRSKNVSHESTYLFAERKTKWVALTATLVMTEFNSATLLSFASLGYAAGFWALTLPLIFLFGLLFYAATVAKKWKAYDGVSVAGLFTQRYGKGIGSFASLLLMMAMIGFSAAYIKSLTLLFMPIVPNFSPWALSLILCALVLAMTLRGGLFAIIRTDLWSFIFVLLFFPLLALFMGISPGSMTCPESFSSSDILPLRFVFSLTVLTMFTYILAPWYGQKIFAAQDGKVAYRAVIAAALLLFLLYASAIVATAFFRYRGYECPSIEMALPHLIDRCLPFGVKGFAYALLFTTSATTLSGVWSAMAGMWIGDFSKREANLSCRRTIWLTLLFAMVSFVMANLCVDKVFDKLILANIPVAALSFALLAGFYWKKASRRGALLSIATGCFCGAGAYLLFGEEGGYTWYWAVLGIPLTFLVGIIGSLLFPEKLSGYFSPLLKNR